MVGIDGADDANVGVKLEEGAVELVGFHDQDAVFLLAEEQVALEVVGDAPDERGRVDAALVKDVGNHGGGSGLAVCAGHRDGEVVFRNLAQGLGAFQYRDVALSQGLEFLEVARDGGRVDDQINEGRQ